MEVALSSIPSVTRDCIPKVLFQRGESRQDAQGTEVLDKCGDSLCHHGESDLGPAPCGKPARFAKDFIQQRLWVRQILASRHRRQTQVHPPGRVANCLPNSHLIEKKPCLLHPNWNHGDPYRGRATPEHHRSDGGLYLISPDFTRFVLSISMDE